MHVTLEGDTRSIREVHGDLQAAGVRTTTPTTSSGSPDSPESGFGLGDLGQILETVTTVVSTAGGVVALVESIRRVLSSREKEDPLILRVDIGSTDPESSPLEFESNDEFEEAVTALAVRLQEEISAS